MPNFPSPEKRALLRLVCILFHVTLMISLVRNRGKIAIKVVHLLLVLVVMPENGVKDDTGGKGEACDARVHPQDLGIDENGYQGLVEGGAESRCEEVQALDEGFHARGRFRVCVFETGDRDEDFGQTDEDVGWRLDGNVDVIWLCDAVDEASRAERWVRVNHGRGRHPVAGAGGVNEMLHDRSVRERERSEPKADGNTCHGAEFEACTAHERVDDAIQNGNEDKNRDGIEVLHDIVGHAVALHCGGLSHEIGGELSIAYPENGVSNTTEVSTSADGHVRLT